MANKKNTNIYILEILTELSDYDHILTTKDIQSILKNRYDIELNRNAIYSNIEMLKQAGYDISDYNDNGKGYYLAKRQFDKGEMLMLCNAIHASHFISSKESDRLIKTLLKTQSKYDSKEFTEKVYLPNPQKVDNKDLMKNIEIISKAIGEGKMLKFSYMKYDEKRKLVPKREKPYTVEPRYIVYSEAKGYLVATNPKYGEYTHYRLYKMTNLEILDQNVAPLPINIESYEYARERLFMHHGEVEQILFKVHEAALDQVIDIIGNDYFFIKKEDEYIYFTTKTTKIGAMYLAEYFVEWIEIIEPKELRIELQNILKKATNKYKD